VSCFQCIDCQTSIIFSDAAMMQMRRATENLRMTQIQNLPQELQDQLKLPTKMDDFKRNA
jgi:hypothetical protein